MHIDSTALFFAEGLRDLVILIIGASLALASTVFVDWRNRKRKEHEKEEQKRKLATLLIEEVERIAELLDVDLQPNHLEISNGPLQGAKLLDLRSPLRRLRDMVRTRSLFEAYSDRLIWFDGYLPNSIAKFHERIIGYSESLEEAAQRHDEEAWEKIRQQAYQHAESLKFELRQVLNTKQ